jgi:hypothetical protein
MTRFGSRCSRSGCFPTARDEELRFDFIAEEINLVFAKWPGRGFSVPDDGLASANVIGHYQPLVVCSRAALAR